MQQYTPPGRFITNTPDMYCRKKRSTTKKGFSVVELLISLNVLSLVGLGTLYSTMLSVKVVRGGERQSVASQLAVRKIEELAAINPMNLSAAQSTTERNIRINNITFDRITAVIVNPDNSRSVTVTVTPTSGTDVTSVGYTSTFSLWGTN